MHANFKMKTIKKFPGRIIQIPTRIQDALQRFTTHVPLPAQTVSEPVSSPTIGLQVLCLNTQVCLQSKIRALHAIIKQTGFPAALMLHKNGKIPNDFVFHPLYASFYKAPNRNWAGACILLRRTQHIVVLEVHFEPNHRETEQVHAFCCEGHSTLWFWRFTLNQTTQQWLYLRLTSG